MSEITIIVAVAIVAAIAGFAIANARGQKGPRDDGRLTLDSKTATSNAVVTPGSSTSAVADAIESTLASIPNLAAAAVKPGVHFSANVTTNFKMIFKVPNKDLANAVAERERAKGMSVVVAAPDETDQNWRVTSTK